MNWHKAELMEVLEVRANRLRGKRLVLSSVPEMVNGWLLDLGIRPSLHNVVYSVEQTSLGPNEKGEMEAKVVRFHIKDVWKLVAKEVVHEMYGRVFIGEF